MNSRSRRSATAAPRAPRDVRTSQRNGRMMEVQVVRGSGHATPAGPPLDLGWALDLLQPFSALLTMAGQLASFPRWKESEEAETGSPLLNLYLVLCALDQILSDQLHSHLYDFARWRRSGQAAGALALVSRIEQAVRRYSTVFLRAEILLRDRQLLALARSLAARILEGDSTAGPEAQRSIGHLLKQRWPTGVLRARLKIPQSFRGVDLYPADCELLASRASRAHGDVSLPVLVVGLRTSGLYLAPFCAATLDRLGHTQVHLITIRPGVPLLPAEHSVATRVAGAGGWALVVDDPSWRGGALATARDILTKTGFSESRVCLGVFAIPNQPVFKFHEADHGSSSQGDRELVWRGLADAWTVIVKPNEWFVFDLLADAHIERYLNQPVVLSRLGAEAARILRGHPFGPQGEVPPMVDRAGPSAAAPRQRRFHALKVFQVELQAGGRRWSELILARGVGQGFFGYHSWLVGSSLGGYVPDVLGLHNGVLLMRWHESNDEVGRLTGDDVDRIAAYVARRAGRLDLGERRHQLPETRAVYTGARQVARLLSRSMGRVGALAQFKAADLLGRVTPPRHAVVDGRMGPSEWVRARGAGLLKVDFEEHGFDITDRCVTDPAHDLASTVIGFKLDPDSQRRLVSSYVRLTGDSANLEARLAVQKLQVGWAELEAVPSLGYDLGSPAGKMAYASELAAREAMLTSTVNRYLAGVYLAGPLSEPAGPVWAIDLDDTLEADRLGFETISPAGALALRMLRQHGQHVVLSTGRSLVELQDRCQTYDLAGGVGEYGSVIWDQRRQEAVQIISSDARRALSTLREAVIGETDIMADPRYGYTLRLFRHTSDGRRGVKAGEVRAVMERHGIEGLEVVEGFRKTVVWAAGVDKAGAFQRLRSTLPRLHQDSPLHVIGDAFTDLALMRLADQRYAPGNAEREVWDARATLGIEIASRRQQAGVLQIVRRALHGPYRFCQRCAWSRDLSIADAALVNILSIQDRGRWGRMLYALSPASMRAFEI